MAKSLNENLTTGNTRAIHASMDALKIGCISDGKILIKFLIDNYREEICRKNEAVAELLSALIERIEDNEMEAFSRYVELYLPYSFTPSETKKYFAFNDKKKNPSNIPVITFKEFSTLKKPAQTSLKEVKKVIFSSPSRRLEFIKKFPSEILREFDYHHYGSESGKKKRRSALLALIKTSSNAVSGTPNSPARAIAVAREIKKLIDHKQNLCDISSEITSWKEDIAFLKYNFYDSVLHLNGIKWPFQSN